MPVLKASIRSVSSDFGARFTCAQLMNHPLHQLPSLDLLRGFVAVARRMSITLAAADLFLTQSAVSRQIRSLEEELGVALFERRHRGIALTPAGERLFRHADAWFDQLGEVLASLRPADAAAPVTVTSTIAVTTLWLLPQLGRFQSAHPALDVRVAAGNRVVADLQREGVDLALRYCTREQAPPRAEHLFDERIVPVASPSLGLRRVAGAAALRRLTLLEYEDVARPWLQWNGWLQAAGKTPVGPLGRLRFNQYDQVIQSALAGHGVALGRAPLIAPMLADGRLVAVEGLSAPARPDYAYWLILREGTPPVAALRFADWLREAARETRALLETLF